MGGSGRSAPLSGGEAPAEGDVLPGLGQDWDCCSVQVYMVIQVVRTL